MKHVIFATCGALAVAGTMTFAAQEPMRPPAPTPSPSTPARTDDRTITVTGCLKTWDEKGGMVPTGDAAGARYVLTNVEGDKGMTDRATPDVAAPAPSGAPAMAAPPTQYVLTPESSVNLAPHVNHKVTVTGKTSTATDDHAAPTSRPGDPEPAQPHAGMRAMSGTFTNLTVSSLTMVSTTCPAPTVQ